MILNPKFNAQDLVLIFHNIFEICAESELTMRSQNFKFKRNEKKLVTWFNFVNFYEIEFFGFSLIRNDSEWCNLNWFIPFYSKALVQYNFNETVSLVLLYLKYSIYFSVQKNSKSISNSLLSEIMVLVHDRTGHS